MIGISGCNAGWVGVGVRVGVGVVGDGVGDGELMSLLIWVRAGEVVGLGVMFGEVLVFFFFW